MFSLDNPLTSAVLLYLLLISFIIYKKPRLAFTSNGNIKKFGIGKKKTIYPLWLIVIMISVVSYYVISIFKLIKISIIQ